MRKINHEGMLLIKQFEMLRTHAYPDPATGGSPWTIGWGHTGGVKRGDTITVAKADELLKADIAHAERAVNALGLHLTDNQFAALVSFTYNAGPYNLGKLLRKGLAAVPDRLPLFIYANHKAMKGLLRRRLAERRLFLEG